MNVGEIVMIAVMLLVAIVIVGAAVLPRLREIISTRERRIISAVAALRSAVRAVQGHLSPGSDAAREFAAVAEWLSALESAVRRARRGQGYWEDLARPLDELERALRATRGCLDGTPARAVDSAVIVVSVLQSIIAGTDG